jgi:adenylate kinase
MNFDPPRNGETCDRCNGRLQQRDDDREETITTRLRVYESQTAPLVNYYRQRGNLREIDGVGKVEDIQKRIIDALGRPAN